MDSDLRPNGSVGVVEKPLRSLPNRRPKDTETDQAVGANIRDARKAVGMTARDLARAVGITATEIGRYETGQVALRANRLRRIAAAIGGSARDPDPGGHGGVPAGDFDERRVHSLIGWRLRRIRDSTVLKYVVVLVDVLAGTLSSSEAIAAERARDHDECRGITPMGSASAS